MPLKWTPDKDQMLLLKILETHNVKIDTAKVVAAWPTDGGEIPTARAVTERLAKIRSSIKSTVSVPNTPKPASTAKSPSKLKRASSGGSPSAKRKTKVKKEDEYDSDTISAQELGSLGGVFKEEDSSRSPIHCRPARSAGMKPGSFAYLLATDDEAGTDTGSEYAHATAED